MARTINTFQGNPISIEKGRNGGIVISAIVDAPMEGYLFTEAYFYYTKKEALSLFRAAVAKALRR